MEVRIKRWFLQKNNMYASSPSQIREGRYTEKSWFSVTKQTDKAYHLDQTQMYIPESGWVPKSVVLEVRGNIDVPNHQTKKYNINERLLFGLESMRDKCMYEIQCQEDNHTLEEIEKLYELYDECCDLISKSTRGPIDGKTYGRISEITLIREEMRFNKCIQTGMNYRDACEC